DNSLFVTEFGFQGPANKKTIEKYLSKDHHSVQDAVFEFHNKQVEGPERIFKFLSGHLPVKTEWDDFLYLAQLNQALALKMCIEHWRMNGITNGSIIWQINDCWPVTSWALIDSELLPKISYHFVKNIFHPQIVSFVDNVDSISIKFLNQNNKEFKGKLKINFFNDFDGEMVYEEHIDILEGKNLKEISKILLKKLSPDKWTSVASLHNEKNELIFRNSYTRERWKHKILSSPNIEVSSENNVIILKSDKPVFFIDLYYPEAEFSERGFIILPGEEKKIKMLHPDKPIRKENLKLFSLNNYLHR
ncbi:MAG: hypothetical protein KJ666_06160, partial [Bacteroidetes bacterium]|nr:hypothetical protein [Bacteroidota bacterium]